MISRRPDWEKIMDLAINARRSVVFSRGKTDCVMTIADIIQEFTGVDLATPFRGTYCDDLGAARIIIKAGGMLPIIHKICTEHGLSPISPKLAARGDMAFVYHGKLDQGIGLFTGQGILTPDRVGFKILPRSAASKAWSIPHGS